MPKLLLIEDDLELVKRLRKWLVAENYTVESVNSGEDALQLLTSFSYDLIILDWTLTDITGLEVCRRFRATGKKTPMIFLTGRGGIDDKERGLDSGADDYICKPFDPRELSARLRSILRRPCEEITRFELGGVSLEIETRVVTQGDDEVRLTPLEASMLAYLMRNPGRPYLAKNLCQLALPTESNTSVETVHTCMKTLRQKLTQLGRANYVTTIPKSGYMIEIA
jgi:DNA-binding response OmpR family regulator